MRTVPTRQALTLPAAVLSLAGLVPVLGQTDRPNVLLIVSDDQGTIDLNCYGADDLYTPHLDALARRGVRFTQFYANAPVCSPSRAAILTGRYPQRAGVPGNVGLGKVGLPPAQTTVAEMLEARGYARGIVGKWHLGWADGKGPLDQGFTRFFGHMKGCIDNYSHFFYWSGPNVHDLWDDTEEHWEDGVHFGDLMVREANRFIEQHRDQPFFLFLPFNIPHYPLQGQARFRKLYRDLPEPRRSYAALVSTFDEKVGQILGKVDALGLRDRTLVIFMSDHGHSTEVRTRSGGGNAGPYRGSKFSLFEGGIRVPAIVSWPGRIPVDVERGQLAMAMDWMPTIAEYTGTKLDPASVDGKSLVGVIERDEPSPHRVVHWETGGGSQWAVRDGDWKLVVNPRDTNGKRVEGTDRVFLSRIDRDATERANIASEHADVVDRLRALHAKWTGDLERD